MEGDTSLGVENGACEECAAKSLSKTCPICLSGKRPALTLPKHDLQPTHSTKQVANLDIAQAGIGVVGLELLELFLLLGHDFRDGLEERLGARIADCTAGCWAGRAGDGGAQFSLPELMCAVQEKLPICFLIWNNHGYQEIATSMVDAGVSVVGCDPTPPDFAAVAQSCGLPFWRCDTRPGGVAEALQAAMVAGGPSLIEIQAQPSPVPAKERA